MQKRQTWDEIKKDFKIGGVVLLADKIFPREEWSSARVAEVKKGRDGLVRIAKIKTSSTLVIRAIRKRLGEVKTSTVILERPTAKLCRMEMDGV